MFAFVTCLRHPRNVKSMSTMLSLLERTLETIESQTNKDYSVTIVCHEIPKLSRVFEKVEFLIVDFEPPVEHAGHLVESLDVDTINRGLEMVKLDKGRKYLAALYHLRKNPPSHVMFFDADDCLSPDIVATVLSGPAHTSWYVGDGYIYSE